ncbi:hypothetical protein [Corallococcus llansteffanensis]|uniref:Lipoprotein n=1 Tax=Corallococcus llansteffanensis TaxID=2316731 RepID=A0A3A8P1Z5_9BACT|nr:hypothetical protein [Corallococcus llansteffanensis]RKH48571.1 hypothetical protein D7V93_33115 [Corallococcus llansteffanensis]
MTRRFPLALPGALLLPVALLSGCAFDAGEGFAVLKPSVQAAYTPLSGRDAGDGYQALASDFQLRMDAASMRLGSIDLLASSGGGGATTFDPSSPPPGYSLCHNGHCHSDSGELVDYEDIEAELGGGGGSTTTTVANLPVDGDLDLLRPASVGLDCQPDCELPRTTLSRGRWSVTGVRMTGSVRDSRVPARFAGARDFRITLAPVGAEAEPLAVLSGDLDVPSDRENAPAVELGLKLELTPALFDAVDWSTVAEAPDGVLDLDAPGNAAVRTAFLERLAQVSPVAEVSRGAR